MPGQAGTARLAPARDARTQPLDAGLRWRDRAASSARIRGTSPAGIRASLAGIRGIAGRTLQGSSARIHGVS